jgi:hypothetical protein
MLYVTYNDKELSILENKMIKKDFILIEYQIKEEFVCTYLGKMFKDREKYRVDEKDSELFEIMDNFFIDLLTYPSEDEKYYYFTNGIIKLIYSKNESSNVGYLYHSAVDKSKFNLCLNPEVEGTIVELKDVFHMRLIEKTKDCAKCKSVKRIY